MTFYIFCSLYQRAVLISAMPYGGREVSTLMQGTQVLIFAKIEPLWLFTNMNFVVPGKIRSR